jgi:hypothetical protein
MRKQFFSFALLLFSLTAGAQKMVVHMTGKQTVEFDAMQLDSITFVEVENPDINPDTDPSVTGDAIDVTNKSATLVGYATSIRDNLSTDLRVGFIYCQEGTPSRSNGTQVDVSVNSVAADGRYTKTIGNLQSEATYYYRSFVYQSGLWFYGKVKSFTTQGISVNFTTGEATAITCFSAKVSGSVNVQWNYSTLTYGICYGTSVEPTTSDQTIKASTNTFTLQLRKLLGGTSYYYRPYAIVDGQTRYGSVHTFRTLDDNVVETGTIDEETLTVTSHLTIGGGAYSTLSLGVCYGKTELPTINDKTVTSNEVDDENNYTVQLANPGFGTISYRAYVLIDNVPHYGAVKSFERHEYVDLGLPSGTLWATCNVGANSPEEYGDYFAWGETTTKSNYNWYSYKLCNGSSTTMTKYCTSSNYGRVDNKTELDPEDDAATVNWGSAWQMPSPDQLEELYNSNYTTTTWTTQNGVNGCKITSKSKGNSIFLPATGYRNDTSPRYAGSFGAYWSRSLGDYSSVAYGLYFGLLNGSDYVDCSYDSRVFGRSVRPVRVQE